MNFGAATGTPTCTCKDWIHFRIPCKHFFAIFNHSKDWKWGSLPNHYLESSHITADTKALDAVCPTIADNLPDHPLDLICSDDDSLAMHEEWSDQEHGPNTTMLIATDSSTSASPSSPQIRVSMCTVLIPLEYRLRALRRKVLNATKVIETLSHTCCSAEHLQTRLEKLHEMIKIFKAELPSSEGLALRPLSLLERA